METSRQKLFEYIQEHYAVTVPEISKALHMTPTNARHHLKILQSSGLIEVIGRKKRPGRGQPSKIYKLSECVLGNNFELLVDAFLTHFYKSNQEDHQQFLKSIAQALAFTLPINENLVNKNLSTRLIIAIQFLNKMNYFARWEAHSDSPRIIFENCPYRSLVNDHPELCLIDQYLLETLLFTKASQIQKLKENDRGLPQCVFCFTGEKH